MNYTVIVPFYNEERNILSFNKELINNLKKFTNEKRSFEIIYIDDGSYDKTFNELENLDTDSLETLLIKHRVNLSQSAALNTGISQAYSIPIITLGLSYFKYNFILHFNISNYKKRFHESITISLALFHQY